MKKIPNLFLLLVPLVCGFARAQSFDRVGEMIRTGQPASAFATAAQAFGQEDDITVLTVRSVAT
jgi:hypothetical protein